MRPDPQARDSVQLYLGVVSLLLWFATSFWLIVALDLASGRPARIILAGFAALLVAAVPWLGYRRLVAAASARARRRRAAATARDGNGGLTTDN